MRFIVMHKVDANMEAGGPPSQSIIKDMGELVQSSIQSGIFLNGAGLHPSARRVRLEAGARAVTAGPYRGENELVASFVMISAKSIDVAIDHARALSKSLGDVEIEVGPVVEPWDLGMMEKPPAPVERFLLLCKSTPADEAGDTSQKHAAAVRDLSASMQEGAVLAAESLAPSSKGARLAASARGKHSWVDGPFTESKELIAGFSLLQLPSKADALAWADRYAAILTINEIDVREVQER